MLSTTIERDKNVFKFYQTNISDSFLEYNTSRCGWNDLAQTYKVELRYFDNRPYASLDV